MVRVLPGRLIMESKKKRFSDLIAIKGHKNFYRSPMSGKIYYKKGADKFSTGETKILAAEREAEIRLKAKSESIPEAQAERDINGITNPTLGEIWPEMFEKRKVGKDKSTLIKYGVGWRISIEPFWGTKRIQEISKNIIPYRNWYLETFPNRHFEKTYIFLNMLFRYCVETKIINEMPDMRPLKEINKIVQKNSRREKVGRVYSEYEIQAILAAIKMKYTDDIKTRATLGVLLGVRCGLRKMEALSLKWDDIFFQKNNLRVWSKKNHKWRFVPMIPEVRTAFLEHQSKVAGSPWVFPMKMDPNRHISGQIFDKVWVAAKGAAGITGKARFHDLRHTFATRTAEAGWPVVVACDVLDQSVSVYSRIYCHTGPDIAAKFMNQTFNTEDKANGTNKNHKKP